jgi:flagellar protein FliS
MNPYQAAKQYQTISAHANVLDADPHRLILVLMESALEKLSMAKGFMQRHNVHDKGVNISLALSMIEALQSSLDKEKGGEIAENLHNLYAYMMQLLLEANMNDTPEKVDEVINLMSTIKEGWEGIPKSLEEKGEE